MPEKVIELDGSSEFILRHDLKTNHLIIQQIVNFYVNTRNVTIITQWFYTIKVIQYIV